MKREMKDYLLIRLSGFRRIAKKKQMLDYLQFAAEALILYETFNSLTYLKSDGKNALFCSLVTLGNIIFHIIRRDKLANYAELALDILYFIILMAVADCFSIAIWVSVLIHLLRIESCYTDEKMKTLFGYPKFVSFYIENALEQDDDFACSVKDEYDKIMENKIVRFSSAISRCNWKMQFIMIISVVFAGRGVVNLSSGIKDRYLFSSAVSVEDTGSCHDGDVICGTVYQIYEQRSIASQKSVRENFIGKFGEKLISFSVPYPYKDDFEKLYTDAKNAYEHGEISTDYAVSANGIDFHGIYLKAEKKIKLLDSTKRKFGDSLPDVEEDFFIEIIDTRKADSNIYAGIIMILLGITAFLFVGILVLKNNDDIKDTEIYC